MSAEFLPTTYNEFIELKLDPNNRTLKENVAIHEHGHAGATIILGGTVTSITAEPQGSTLGQTGVIFEKSSTIVRAISYIGSLAASREAEAITGIVDHSGTAHDESVIDLIAYQTSLTEGKAAGDYVKREGRHRGRRAVDAIGPRKLVERGIALAGTPIVLYHNPRLDQNEQRAA